MASLFDLSTTAASNTSIGGVNVGEGCPPGNLNDGLRALGAYAVGALKAVAASGTNTISVTLAPAPAAYVTGMSVRFIAAGANTGATTLNLNSLGAKSIYKPGASGPTALTGGEIQSGQVVEAVYDGTQFVMVSPVASAVQSTRTIASGNGLTGGGDLSADRTLAVGAGTGIVANADDVAVDKATQANMQSETSNKVATADVLKYHPGVAKVSVAFHWSGTAMVVDEGYGVSSITRTATGDYTINFSVTFANTNFRVTGSFDTTSNVPTGFLVRARTTTSVRINVGSGSTYGAADFSLISVNVYGTLA